MGYVDKAELKKIREINAFEYLSSCEPQELKRIGANEYCLRSHDSLHVNENGKWHWLSHGESGYTALDFLIKVYGMELPQAVEALGGKTIEKRPPPPPQTKEPLILPPKHADNKRVFSYLTYTRKISPEVVNWCIEHGFIYETADYHSACFVGYDGETAKYANLRGTLGNFKGECKNSDKRYSFNITPNANSDTLYVCESAIDALSIATLKIPTWRNYYYLSLGGASNIGERLPLALEKFLKTHEGVRYIRLCLDNDRTGQESSLQIQKLLTDYEVESYPPSVAKDWNQYLVSREVRKKKAEMER